MKLIATKHGRFAEIDHLNPNFRNEYKRLKITIDTVAPKEFYLGNFPTLMFTILELFPNLRNHSCNHGKTNHTQRDYDTSHLIAPIKIVGDVIDTVHLLEHVILELQCQIGSMEVCSGLTCNYWEPENRYDVFIECAEPELATFACNLALDVFQKISNEDVSIEDVRDLLQIAHTVYGGIEISTYDVARELNWPTRRVSRLIEKLEKFNFPFPAMQPAA